MSSDLFFRPNVTIDNSQNNTQFGNFINVGVTSEAALRVGTLTAPPLPDSGAALIGDLSAGKRMLITDGPTKNTANVLIQMLGVKDGCDFEVQVERAYERKKKELNELLKTYRNTDYSLINNPKSDIERALRNLNSIRKVLKNLAKNKEVEKFQRGKEKSFTGKVTRIDETGSAVTREVTIEKGTNVWVKKKCVSRPKKNNSSQVQPKADKKNEKVGLSGLDTDIFEEAYAASTLSPSKFIKCYCMFNSKTPTPFVRATISYPIQFVKYDETAPANIDINQYVIEQDIDEPPYNKITSFTYDVFARTVELEIRDNDDTLGEFFLTQLTSLESYNGAITVYVRFGWSAPYLSKQNSILIEDVDSYIPPRIRQTTFGRTKLQLTSRARMYNAISFNLNDMEISKDGTSTLYKLKGSDNDYEVANPFLSRWRPINNRNLSSMPLGQLGMASKFTEIIRELKDKIFSKFKITTEKTNNIQEVKKIEINLAKLEPKPGKLNPAEKKIYESIVLNRIRRDSQSIAAAERKAKELINLIFKMEKLRRNDIQKLDELKRKIITNDEQVRLAPLAVGDEKDVIEEQFEKKRDEVYGLNIITLLKNEVEEDAGPNDEAKARVRELLAYMLTLCKNTKIPVADAMGYILNEAQNHMKKINEYSGLQRNKLKFCVLNFANFKIAKTPGEKDAEYIKNIPVNSIFATTTTTYKRLIEDLASKIKIESKTTKGNKVFLDLNVGWFHAKSKVEIEDLIYALALRRQEVLETPKDKQEKNKNNNKRYIEYLDVMYEKLKNQIKEMLETDYEFFWEKPATIKGKLREKILQEFDHLIVCVLSEYSMEGFTDIEENGEANMVLHGYCFRPQGFKTTMNDITIKNDNAVRSKTTFDTGVNTNYFQSGTLNLYDVNTPDIINFTPTIDFNLIRTATTHMNKKDPYENFNELLDSAVTTKEQREKIRAEVKRRKELTKEQLLKEIEMEAELANVNTPLVEQELYAKTMGETDYEKFPTLLNTIPYSNNPRSKLNNKFHRTIFKNRLANFLKGYEAEMVIMGEPYFDQNCINKYLYIKVLTSEGTDTFYTGIYQILNAIHNREGGSYKTTLKLSRTKNAVNQVSKRMIGFLEYNSVKPVTYP